MKKILLFLLCIASITLTGCYAGDESNVSENSFNENNIEESTSSENVEVSTSDDETMVISGYYPVVVSFQKDTGIFTDAFVIGGSKDGKWYGLDAFEIPYDSDEYYYEEAPFEIELVKGNEEYNLYSVVDFRLTTNGGPSNLRISPSSGEALVRISIEEVQSEDKILIGSTGEWDALMNSTRRIENNLVFADFDQNGVEDKIEIVELPSDDMNEILLKCTINDQTFEIKTETYIGGNSITEFRVLPIDLNGDKVLELVTLGVGHNRDVSVYSITEEGATLVLSFYDGD